MIHAEEFDTLFPQVRWFSLFKAIRCGSVNSLQSAMVLGRIKILLLQARNLDDPMKEHELNCFIQKTGLDCDQVIPHSLLEGPPSRNAVGRVDALMVGGSGEFDVSKENLPFYFDFLEFLHACVSRNTPLFASCFGYQCLVVALGGKIVRDDSATEVGTFQLKLTPQGKADPLFEGFPDSFRGSMGHKDRACEQPPGVPNLASSELCLLQALRIPGKPMWATQFHPELDRKTNLDRFQHYFNTYAIDACEAVGTA